MTRADESPVDAETPTVEFFTDCFRIGEFKISRYRDGSLWIARPDGEGMETSPKKLEKAIADFFWREM